MSVYTFDPTTATQQLDWSDEAIWAGGAVPDDADADVVFPVVYFEGSPHIYYVTIGADEDIAVQSIALDDYLIVSGALDVAQSLTLGADAEFDLTGGTLSAGALVNAGVDLQGYGEVDVTGAFANHSEVVGDGLTIAAASLNNTGSLIAASGGLTLDVAAGGFVNLDGTTLTGGSYEALAGALRLNVGALVTDIAADVTFGYGDILSYDPAAAQYASLRDSVDEIAASGVLTLAADSFAWGPLADQGAIDLEGATLASPDLEVDGKLTGYGTIASAIANDGEIVTGFLPAAAGDDVMSATLKLAGAVTGTGSLEISAGLAPVTIPGSEYQPPSHVSTLELGSAADETVVFANDVGILQLDDPAGFAGAIETSGWGDQIVLSGVALAGITGVSYLDDGEGGGTLTLATASGALALNFIGEFTAENFALTAIPSALSTVPPSLEITLQAVAAGDYVASAAALSTLTEGQIAALAAQGVSELSASDGDVCYGEAAAEEIVAAKLAVSAPTGDFVRETFADGSFEIRHFVAGGETHGAAFASAEDCFTVSGFLSNVNFLDAAGGSVASLSRASGGDALEVGGVTRLVNTVGADGDFQISAYGPNGPAYSARQGDFDARGAEVADVVDADARQGQVNLFAGGLAFSSAGTAGPAGGADDFDFTPRARETYAFFAGASDDRVAFAAGFGAATIRGFSAASGDVLDLSGLFANFSAMLDATTMAGRDVDIADAGGDRLTLVGVAAGALTSARFGFA